MLEKTLESPLDCKEIQPVHPKGNQSWIFIGRTDLKLKLQYFGYLMWRTDSFEKTLMLGKFEGRRTRGQQRMRWLDGITDSNDMVWINSGSWWWTGRPGVLQSIGSQRVRHDWVTNTHFHYGNKHWLTMLEENKYETVLNFKEEPRLKWKHVIKNVYIYFPQVKFINRSYCQVW